MYKRMIGQTVGDFVVDPWSAMYWTLPAFVRMDETVLSECNMIYQYD